MEQKCGVLFAGGNKKGLTVAVAPFYDALVEIAAVFDPVRAVGEEVVGQVD